MDAIQPLLFFLPAIALGMFILFFSRRRMRRKLEPLAELLDEHSGDPTGFFAVTLAGHFRSREAAFLLIPGGKNRPRKFFIEVACAGSLVFEIYREGMGTRFAKKLHLLKDVEIGDSELDEKLVFSCKDPERFSRWIASTEVKAAVSSLLLARDVDRLALETGRLRAIHIHYGDDDFERERVRGVLGEMETLARALESAGALRAAAESGRLPV